MVEVQHPTFSDVRHEVPDTDADAWLAQGWVKVEPKKRAASKSSQKRS